MSLPNWGSLPDQEDALDTWLLMSLLVIVLHGAHAGSAGEQPRNNTKIQGARIKVHGPAAAGASSESSAQNGAPRYGPEAGATP